MAQAVAHVSAVDSNAEAAAAYERLVASSAAAGVSDTAVKVQRGIDLEKQPSQVGEAVLISRRCCLPGIPCRFPSLGDLFLAI